MYGIIHHVRYKHKVLYNHASIYAVRVPPFPCAKARTALGLNFDLQCKYCSLLHMRCLEASFMEIRLFPSNFA